MKKLPKNHEKMKKNHEKLKKFMNNKKNCKKMKKKLVQQSCARKAGFLYLFKQQFSFSLKYKY